MRVRYRLYDGFRLWLAAWLVLGFILGAAPVAQAASPAAPNGVGLMYVNTVSDSVTKDSALSLREALLIARGGTGLTGLNRTLSDGEITKILGACTFSGSANAWTIDALSCGTGVTDTIFFDSGYFTSPQTITLTSRLPLIDDSKPTIIDGLSRKVTIDASGVSFNPGLEIASNNNSISNIGVANASGGASADFGVLGDNNYFSGDWAWGGFIGFDIFGGNNNTINNALIGVPSAATSCHDNRSNLYGVVIEASGTGNTVKNSTVGCNSDDGISIRNDGNVVGPSNLIGTNGSGNDLGNFGTGVYIFSSHNIVTGSNTIANSVTGVYVSGDWNQIGGNTIVSNTIVGAWVSAGQFNQIGGTFPYNIGGNVVSGNGGDGIALAGSTVTSSYVGGNYVGTNALGTLVNPNGQNGVHLQSGAHGNYVGDLAMVPNVIGGNGQAGVAIDSGAYGNQVANNKIGVSLFNTPIANATAGVTITGGAYNNKLISGNLIEYNGVAGVGIFQGNTTTNTVTGNTIQYNGKYGIQIDLLANNNQVGSGAAPNLVSANGMYGIYVSNGAHHNTIDFNRVTANGSTGVQLQDSGTSYNTLSGTLVYSNTGNGILIQNGASYNGLNATQAYSNGVTGVYLSNTSYDTVISARANANRGYGIVIAGTSAGNLVSDTVSYRNTGPGLSLAGMNNSVEYSDFYNNTDNGINVWGSATMTNSLYAVYSHANSGYGLSISQAQNNSVTHSLFELNGLGGIEFAGGAFNNRAGLGTVANYNSGNGFLIHNGAHDNVIQNGDAYWNSHNGVELSDAGVSGNTVGAEAITGNALDGINERNGADHNVWAQVDSWANGGMGIDKNAPSDNTNIPTGPSPVIVSVTFAGGQTWLVGKASPAVTTTVYVEVYNVSPDATGFGDGHNYLATVQADANGRWSYAYAGTPACYTAFQTVYSGVTGTSSEYGPNTCRVLLPIIQR